MQMHKKREEDTLMPFVSNRFIQLLDVKREKETSADFLNGNATLKLFLQDPFVGARCILQMIYRSTAVPYYSQLLSMRDELST